MIEFEEDYQSQAEFLRDLAAGSYPMAGEYAMTIYDGEGNELYTDCWNFGQSLREEYAPQGAENLLEVVNNTPELNGMLSTIYNNIASALERFTAEVRSTSPDGIIWKKEIQTSHIFMWMRIRSRFIQTGVNTKIT